MFGQDELDQLRMRKQLLMLESDANRLTLTAEWQRLRSPEFWQSKASHAVRQHPLVTAALAAVAGVVAIKAVRRPGAVLGWLGGLSGAGSTLLSVWKLFRPK